MNRPKASGVLIGVLVGLTQLASGCSDAEPEAGRDRGSEQTETSPSGSIQSREGQGHSPSSETAAQAESSSPPSTRGIHSDAERGAGPAGIGSYEYEMRYDDGHPSTESRTVTAGPQPNGRLIESPVSGLTELMRWTPDGIEVLETYTGPKQRRCVWDRPILFVPFRPTTLTSESRCTIRDGDARTEIHRADSVTSVMAGTGVTIKYSTEKKSELFVDSPTWRGGNPGTRITMSGHQEWNLPRGLPEEGRISLQDDTTGNGRTVDFQLLDGG